jgi:hypothetical protein
MVVANRVEYHRGELTEWYVNDVRGIEQGFTLDSAPPGREPLPWWCSWGPRGASRPGSSTRARRWWCARLRAALLRYDKLLAYDATGAEVPAHMGLEGSTLTLTVDDAGAAYPLVIDPLIATQQAKLSATDATAGDQFGSSVAVSGDTAVVGAPFDDDAGSNSGSAYVFVPSTVSIDDVTVTEDDAGTTDATFTVTRSSPSGTATVEGEPSTSTPPPRATTARSTPP